MRGSALKSENASRPWSRILACALCAGMALVTLPGCQADSREVSLQTVAMDTFMDLTVWSKDEEIARDALNQASALIQALDETLSATREDSVIYALNHAGGAWTDVGADTAQLLDRALELSRLTGGALDITAYPAVQAWGFISGEYRVPDDEELEKLAALIDYTKLEVDGTQARLPQGMEVELGAVAKGYTGDRLAQLMEELRITSALFDLGQSSIQAIGTKPGGSLWRIGLQDPAGSGYLGVLEVADQAVGTSGGYQRCFEENGQTYWHILDPDTAAPARSGLASVTVVSSSGLLCDGLSTALFVLGQEKGIQLWRDHPELDFEAIFISQDGTITMTAGLEDSFALVQGYEDREVTVLS